MPCQAEIGVCDQAPGVCFVEIACTKSCARMAWKWFAMPSIMRS